MTEWNTTADAACGVELYFGYRDEAGYVATVTDLVDAGVAAGIAAQDPTLWGKDVETEAAKRLSWVDLPTSSRPLVAEIEAVRARLAEAGIDHVVLCGMGGSSLAPEVICATAGVELTVLDSSDPDTVRAATADRLERTVVVVSSKSGSTLETDSQRRAYVQAFTDAGLDPAQRIVVVTDPDSPLETEARAAGFTVFTADPDVGGRYSALTAFGLVPSGLAGADLGGLLDDAESVASWLGRNSPDNPGLRLGGLLGFAASHGVDKMVVADANSSLEGFANWVEQLVAESTGKNGTGILPVVVENTASPNYDPNTPDSVLVTIGDLETSVRPASGWGASVRAPLGAQLLIWEHATAVVGRVLGINPFDQPDVESAKSAARGLLEDGTSEARPDFADGAIEVYATPGLVDGTDKSVRTALSALLDQVDGDRGYLAVTAYLDRGKDAGVASIRDLLALRTQRPTTFGWGPRFLHSTGQYHKGGPPTGVYLQLTGVPAADLRVPAQPFTFGQFILAQSAGDAQVLGEHGRPVLRLHLTERVAGIAQLMDVVG